MSTAPYVALATVLDRIHVRLQERSAERQLGRILGRPPFVDPFLDPAGADDPNPLDTVDPAWGLGSAHPDHPLRVEARRIRAQAAPVVSEGVCPACGGLGFVATVENGDAGYRPCHRCPRKTGGEAA